MRFLTYRWNGRIAFGAVIDGGIVDLAARLPEFGSLRDVLDAGALDLARRVAEEAVPDHPLKGVEFLPPIPDPQKICCIGVNYGNRNQEYGDATPAAPYPSLFLRTRESLVGHLEPIVRPPESEQLDYEGEIVMVVGKAGRRIPENEARAHVAGLTMMNEGTIRDWLRHSKFNVTQGKNFERSGSVGPWLVSLDEIGRFDDLHVVTRVNGEVRQDDRTDNLLFSFEYLISYLSTFMRLQPGDLISTGTPTGAGARFDPPRYLKPGDVIEVTGDGIGTLKNVVEDEIP